MIRFDMQATKGIPTEYKSYRFRSRLEARWARFFDLLGWRWEYEPVDFNGWIPDFAIYGDCGNIVYVEVKPVTRFPKKVADKIDASGCEDEVLIVGQTLSLNSAWDMPLGWLREYFDVEDEEHYWWWDEAVFGCWAATHPHYSGIERVGFCHAEFSWHDRITGNRDGDCGRLQLPSCFVNGKSDLNHLWALAANQTYWHPVT